MVPPEADNLIISGKWGEVRYGVGLNGELLTRKFIESLSEKVQTKIGVKLELLATAGRIVNEQHFKKERGEIYALKLNQIRITCFRHRSTWYLLSDHIKKKDKWRPEELDKADRLMEEVLLRLK